jgi:hypothetical protein
LIPLPPFVRIGAETPAVYQFVARLPGSAVLLELPFGEVAFETRYVFYSTVHWHRLVNGYSGGTPIEYALLSEALKDLALEPDRAWHALTASGATHVIVHESSYAGGKGGLVTRWLAAHGARELAVFGSDHLLSLEHSS